MKNLARSVLLVILCWWNQYPAFAASCFSDIAESTPSSAFYSGASNGVVVHQGTGLMWARCSLGQTWSPTTHRCDGTAASYTWTQALEAANHSTLAGYTDWRVPNLKEMTSITERRCFDPAINENIFPGTPTVFFWSASTYHSDPNSAWNVYSFNGVDHVGPKSGTNWVRLVRGGRLFDSFESRKKNSATTITGTSPSPSVVGQNVAVRFRVAGVGAKPTGKVTVSNGEGATCTATVGQGSCNLSFTTLGRKSLIAEYSGNADFNPSRSESFMHRVRGTSLTAITGSDPNPSVVGQSVTVNFRVTGAAATPTGMVSVNGGGNIGCTASVAAGSCNLTFTTVGTKTLTASYAGDANYNASTSAPVTQQVNQANSITNIAANTPNPSLVGQTVTVNFGVTGAGVPPSGMVTVSGDENIRCSASVAAGTCNLTFTTAGAKTLTASYLGDANYNSSTSAPVTHQVNKANDSPVQTIPTLSQWAMIVLTLLLGSLGIARARRVG
ncbi:MAG: IPTL-CTERM sorting domain-containing protein [Methylococcales bacterium]